MASNPTARSLRGVLSRTRTADANHSPAPSPIQEAKIVDASQAAQPLGNIHQPVFPAGAQHGVDVVLVGFSIKEFLLIIE
jgi:hypothetical protein